jgi:hypothetical protein
MKRIKSLMKLKLKKIQNNTRIKSSLILQDAGTIIPDFSKIAHRRLSLIPCIRYQIRHDNPRSLNIVSVVRVVS